MPAAVELPNKELTPQMERRGDGGGSGEGGGVEGVKWCEEEKGVAGGRDATAVSSGLWNQELCALLRPCTATTTTPTTSAPLRLSPAIPPPETNVNLDMNAAPEQVRGTSYTGACRGAPASLKDLPQHTCKAPRTWR